MIGLMVGNVGLWLAKTFAWRRVKQDSRNGGHLNGFNRKADKNEGTLVSGSKKKQKSFIVDY